MQSDAADEPLLGLKLPAEQAISSHDPSGQ